MNDTTRRLAPDERVPLALASPHNAIIVTNSPTIYYFDAFPETYSVTRDNAALLPIDFIELPPDETTPPGSHQLPNLVEALDTGDNLIATMVAAFPVIWSEMNNKGATITKRKLENLYGGHTRNRTAYKICNNQLSHPTPYKYSRDPIYITSVLDHKLILLSLAKHRYERIP